MSSQAHVVSMYCQQEQQYVGRCTGSTTTLETPLIVTIEIAGATKSFDHITDWEGVNLYAPALLGLKECRGGQER